MPATRPLPTVIGPTENALRALLNRTLSSTRIPGYPSWVVLNAVSNADAGGSWRQAVANGLDVQPDEVDAVLSGLRAAGLVDDERKLTELGAAELAAARSSVRGTTLRLVEGIDEAQQETTRRVLDAIRQRAEESLSA